MSGFLGQKILLTHNIDFLQWKIPDFTLVFFKIKIDKKKREQKIKYYNSLKLKLNKNEDRYKKIYEKKLRTSAEDLCKGFPGR